MPQNNSAVLVPDHVPAGQKAELRSGVPGRHPDLDEAVNKRDLSIGESGELVDENAGSDLQPGVLPRRPRT